MLGDLAINLLAAAIGGIVVLMWQRLVVPSFIEYFREPTKLAPEYRARLDFGRGPHHEIRVSLQKRGYTVHGRLRFTEGSHRGKEYPLAGRYYHGLLTFVYWAADKDSTSQGAVTVQRRKDGQLLVGCIAYYSQEQDSVATVPVKFEHS